MNTSLVLQAKNALWRTLFQQNYHPTDANYDLVRIARSDLRSKLTQQKLMSYSNFMSGIAELSEPERLQYAFKFFRNKRRSEHASRYANISIS